jgi:coiled-coil domain-containing protein 130
MPFAVWCTTCKPHETIIGQGVRFNAEKKKIGNYHSTPIYSFRMRHPACGGWIEIRTDPKNTAYVVAEGGRKRDTGEDREAGVGEIMVKLPGEKGEVNDPFAKLEGKVEDKKVVDEGKRRILELQGRQARDWDDPYEMSRRLRRTFRAERKGLESAEAKREALKDKMSLGIEIVDETEEDRLRAGFVDFGAEGDTTAARIRPMFESRGVATEKKSATDPDSKSKSGKRRKTADLVAERKAVFRSELTGNTRAAVDPFLSLDGNIWQPEVKRRKMASDKAELNKKETQNKEGSDSENRTSFARNEPSTEANETPSKTPESTTPLVAYASDSD